MKKPVKITLISIGALIGLVVVLLLVVCWLVFTPARLTGIVNDLAGKYVLCESKFGSVDLSLFRTFPDVGLEVHDVSLVNPTGGAVSDTVASVSNLTVAVDLKRFLKDGAVEVHQLYLDDVDVNLYVSPEGKSNFDVFLISEDDSDTTSFSIPESIDIQKVKVSNLNGLFKNEKGHYEASLRHLDLGLKGTLQKSDADISLNLSGGSVASTVSDSVGRPSFGASVDGIDLDVDVEGDIKSIVLSDLSMALKGGCVKADIYDSLSRKSFSTRLDDLKVSLKGKGSADDMSGRIEIKVPGADLSVGGSDYINEFVKSAKGDLLCVNIPFTGSLKKNSFSLREALLSLKQYQLTLDGDVEIPHDSVSTVGLQLAFQTNEWGISPLLSMSPEMFVLWKKGMALDGLLKMAGSVSGVLGGGHLPDVDAEVTLKNGRFSHKSFPYDLSRVSATVSSKLFLEKKRPSDVNIRNLTAYSGANKVTLSGNIFDLLGEMKGDVDVSGNIDLSDLKRVLPNTLPIQMKGVADINMSICANMQQVQKMEFEKMIADGTLKIHSLDVLYDSIHATSPQLDIELNLPAGKSDFGKAGDLVLARVTGGKVSVDMTQSQLDCNMTDPDISVSVSNFFDKKKKLSAGFDIAANRVNATLDSIEVHSENLKLKGSVTYDSTQKTVLRQFDPKVDADMHRTLVYMPQFPEAVRFTSLSLSYRPEKCTIKNVDVNWGVSDYHLSGNVKNIDEWLSKKALLEADLSFTSNYTDVDQLMSLFSGLGSDQDSLEIQRMEADPAERDANPFIVPKNMRVVLETNVKRCVAFGNDLSDLGGTITLNDGVAVFNQIGFVCKAARMQLTAVYKSPRFNHLFAALDFHLMDIQMDELLSMMPSIVTMVPMLSSLKGNANLHFAAETYLNALYKPKMSTLLASAALDGKNLVVLDNETFEKISKLLMFKKQTANMIDSLDVEMTVFRDELELYPFLLSIDKYQMCASGFQSLDSRCNYHLELLKSPLPIRIAVDVKGTIKKPKIELGSIKYAELYKPEKQNKLQAQTMAIKKMVRESLEANVR